MPTGRGAIRACIFDAYGTLFDVGAAARRAAAEPGFELLAERWPAIAQHWRIRQLEYTWLRTVAGAHADFWQVTRDALDWTLEREGLDRMAPLRSRLLELYWKLEAFPEIHATLAQLGEAGYRLGILSNGTEPMLEAAVKEANLGQFLETALSVDRVGVFKPHARVYALVEEHMGCAPGEVAFISSNGWDAAAAAGFGFRSIWANRDGAPVERLPWRPEALVSDLTEVPEAVEGFG